MPYYEVDIEMVVLDSIIVKASNRKEATELAIAEAQGFHDLYKIQACNSRCLSKQELEDDLEIIDELIVKKIRGR